MQFGQLRRRDFITMLGGEATWPIASGVNPGEIPVEQPSKFDLIINLTTAKALELAIPESFLLRADEVIE